MTFQKFRFLFFFLFVVIQLVNKSSAQNSILATIKDYETHEKLIGVSVSIKNLKLGTIVTRMELYISKIFQMENMNLFLA